MLKRLRNMLAAPQAMTRVCASDSAYSHADSAAPGEGAGHTSATLVARQPIFDRDAAVWGYELLFRRPPDTENFPSEVDSNVATSSVIADGFSIVQPALLPNQKVLINFTAELLEQQIPKVLPAAQCGVEILENVAPSREVLRSLLHLKHDGYLLAVDDYVGQGELELFLKVADIVKVDVLGRPLRDVFGNVKNLKQYPCLLLAEKVEDQNTFQVCHRMGFDLFQGFFFSRPEIMRGKKLSASQAVKMRLLTKLSDENFSVAEIGEALRADVSLVYKLMKYLNSVHFSLPMKVRSVEHGIALLGSKKLKQWLCVTVLSELETAPMAKHVVSQAAQRGKFLELLGTGARGGVESNSLFLLGLFSLLETLLSVSLEDMLKDMPLDEEIVSALQGGESAYTPWLRLLTSYERAEWDETMAVMGQLGLSEERVVKAYEESLQWAMAFFD